MSFGLRFSLYLGLILCVISAARHIYKRAAPPLHELGLLVMSSVTVVNGVRLEFATLYGAFDAFGEFQVAIFLGGLALIYLSLLGIVRIIYPR